MDERLNKSGWFFGMEVRLPQKTATLILIRICKRTDRQTNE